MAVMEADVSARPTRVLLVGPLPIAGDVVGGTKVSFARLAQALGRAPDFAVDVLSTSRRRAGRGVLGRLACDALALVRAAGAMLRRARRSDVLLLNVSARGALFLGPLAWLACALGRVPLAVRLYGGDFEEVLSEAPSPLRRLAARTFLRAPLLLLQTRALCATVGAPHARRWLPTTRELAPRRRADADGRGARRFVFVGQLRPEKGLREALAASDGLPADARLELYGPAMPGFDPRLVEAHQRARYGGPLDVEAVASVLGRSDVLVFPSYHPGEGLPGVVVEALQIGLPVIAARWKALPELVEDGRNGLLVAPGSVDELRAALLRVAGDGELFQELARGARESGEAFRESRWQPRLQAWLRELASSAELVEERV